MYINKEVQIELNGNSIEDFKKIVVTEFKNNFNAGFFNNNVIQILKLVRRIRHSSQTLLTLKQTKRICGST